MTRIEQALAEALSELSRLGKSAALVGGLAVSVRTEPRFTRDVDFAVVVRDDAEAEELVRALSHKGYQPAALVEQDAVGRLATARLVAPLHGGMPLMIDLLFASSGIEREVVSEAESLEVFAGSHVLVATVHHLLALKILSRDDAHRPQDLADIRALVAIASDEQIAATQIALRAIEQRGFSRGKDLDAELRGVVAMRT
jgi:hypothetical protein